MKLLALYLLFGPANALSPVTLAWNYDFSKNPSVTNFMIYYGTQSGNYTAAAHSKGTNLNTTVQGLVRGSTYFFRATALSSTGIESDYSNEVQYRVPNKPNKPSQLIIK